MLDMIEVHLKNAGFDNLRLDGSMSQQQREDTLSRFKRGTVCFADGDWCSFFGLTTLDLCVCADIGAVGVAESWRRRPEPHKRVRRVLG